MSNVILVFQNHFNLCGSAFAMKPLAEWTVDDLQKLIDDDVRESIELDYKRSDALGKSSPARNELAKDVSSFANSAGGRLVYGVVEEGNSPKSIDGGCDPKIITREWLEQTINSTVHPRVAGVFIKPIDLSNGNCAYVIDIPRAMAFAPHQAPDKKYYRRFNFASVPMEDYEVKDAMRRATVGHPVVRLNWTDIKDAGSGDDEIQLAVSITNESSEPVLYASVEIALDGRLVSQNCQIDNAVITRNSEACLSNGMIINDIVVIHRNIMPINHMPIYKERSWFLYSVKFPKQNLGDFFVSCNVTCPGFSSSIGGFAKYDGALLNPGEVLAALIREAGCGGWREWHKPLSWSRKLGV